MPFSTCFRRRNLKYVVTQRQMNKMYEGPKYKIMIKYAFAVMTILVTLFYCSGMPILLLFASIMFYLKYLIDKYMLLRYNNKPPQYDHSLLVMTINLMPWAVVMHLVVGII